MNSEALSKGFKNKTQTLFKVSTLPNVPDSSAAELNKAGSFPATPKTGLWNAMLVLFFCVGDLFLDHDERNVCYAFSCLVISKPRKGSNVWFAGPSGPQRVVTESQLVPSMASGFAGSGTGQTSHLEPVEARHCAAVSGWQVSVDPCYLLLECRRFTASLCYSRLWARRCEKDPRGRNELPPDVMNSVQQLLTTILIIQYHIRFLSQ